MNRQLIQNIVFLLLCLFAFTSDALCQQEGSSLPHIFAINGASPWSSNTRELIAISPGGSTNITELSGNVLYGMDDEVIAFLQTPAGGTNRGSRLLVVNRKTCAVIADQFIKDFGNGFHPTMMKASTVGGHLAVRSRDSSVYVPINNRDAMDVAEVNWQTGKARQLSVPVAEGAERWEITALYSVPPGIAIERGPFLTILDPTDNATLLSLNNAGSDLRPTGNFYAFPGFGIFQSERKDDTIHHVVEGDFSTKITSPVVATYPSSIANLIKFSKPFADTIEDEPCLIWGETTNTTTRDSISDIVVFDVKADKEILRKSFEPGFSQDFLTDSKGQHIYCFNPQEKEYWSLDVKTGEMNPFAAGAADVPGLAAN